MRYAFTSSSRWPQLSLPSLPLVRPLERNVSIGTWFLQDGVFCFLQPQSYLDLEHHINVVAKLWPERTDTARYIWTNDL